MHLNLYLVVSSPPISSARSYFLTDFH